MTEKTKTLYLVLKFKYFDQVLAGEKPEEYRLYRKWKRRLVGREYDKIVLMRGYTKTCIELPYNGYTIIKAFTHEEWDNEPQKVFAIKLNARHCEEQSDAANQVKA